MLPSSPWQTASVFCFVFFFKQEAHSLRYCPLHEFSLSSLCFLKERPEREPKLDLQKPSVPAIPPKKPRPPKTNSLSRPGALPPRRPERPVGPLTHTRYCAALDAEGGSGVGQPEDTGLWPLGSLVLFLGRSGSEAGRRSMGFRITDENPGPGILALLTCGNSLCTLRARPAALQTGSARGGLPSPLEVLSLAAPSLSLSLLCGASLCNPRLPLPLAAQPYCGPQDVV